MKLLLDTHVFLPFDRILVAQALQHGMTIATVDAAVIAYPVPVLPQI